MSEKVGGMPWAVDSSFATGRKGSGRRLPGLGRTVGIPFEFAREITSCVGFSRVELP